VKILIIEDNRHMRRVLKEMVCSALAPEEVLDAGDVANARHLLRECQPDLVLMDVALPDGNGIALTAEVMAMYPATMVVVVSTHQTRASREAARLAGAAGFVAKDEASEKLVPTLLAVLGTTDSVLSGIRP
jgi:DNA-binding NarL/FixJ family response regulator